MVNARGWSSVIPKREGGNRAYLETRGEFDTIFLIALEGP